MMTPERLRYAARGQIVRESDGQLVSPRDVVKWFNELCRTEVPIFSFLLTVGGEGSPSDPSQVAITT